MTSRYRVVPTATFQEDVERLEEFIIQLIIQRELSSNTPDDTCLSRFRDAVERAMGVPSFAPHTCRRCEEHREFRELLVPFGHGGCVVLFAIRDQDVLLLAARDPHEHGGRQLS